jgi:hypothetical protein
MMTSISLLYHREPVLEDRNCADPARYFAGVHSIAFPGSGPRNMELVRVLGTFESLRNIVLVAEEGNSTAFGPYGKGTVQAAEDTLMFEAIAEGTAGPLTRSKAVRIRREYEKLKKEMDWEGRTPTVTIKNVRVFER